MSATSSTLGICLLAWGYKMALAGQKTFVQVQAQLGGQILGSVNGVASPFFDATTRPTLTEAKTLINDAYRESNLTGLSSSPTTAEQAEALAAVVPHVISVFGKSAIRGDQANLPERPPGVEE